MSPFTFLLSCCTRFFQTLDISLTATVNRLVINLIGEHFLLKITGKLMNADGDRKFNENVVKTENVTSCN